MYLSLCSISSRAENFASLQSCGGQRGQQTKHWDYVCKSRHVSSSGPQRGREAPGGSWAGAALAGSGGLALRTHDQRRCPACPTGS